MKNDIKSNWGILQGIYENSDEKINGRKSWKSDSISSAIWYTSKHEWAVGRLRDIKEDLGGIRSFGGQSFKRPIDVPNGKWKYADDGKWKEPKEVDDIIIECIDYRGKYFYKDNRDQPLPAVPYTCTGPQSSLGLYLLKGLRSKLPFLKSVFVKRAISIVY